MAQRVITRYPFSGKNQVGLAAEEIDLTTGAVDYGKNRAETITGTTPNGGSTWKSLGYITGGQISEARTIEETPSIGYRNIQQLPETKLEYSGNLDIDYQNARPFYYAISANNGQGTPVQTAPGVVHTDNVGSITGLNRHIFYEPELVSGSYTTDAIPELPSFNLIDGYKAAGSSQPKVVRKLVGTKVDSVTFNFSRDGIIKTTMNWKAAQMLSSQATTAANLLLSDYLSYEEVFPPVFGKIYVGSWTFPTSDPTWTSALDTALAATGNLLGDATVSSLTIAHTLEPYFVMNDMICRSMPAQQRRYEGRITVGFVNEAMHIKFLGEINNTYAANPSGKGDGSGSVSGSVLTDAGQTWVTSELVGANLNIAGTAYPITANDATTITVTGSPPAGTQAYSLSDYTTGYGTWTMPWFGANRMNYYALKIFYDNSSLGYSASNANYRKIDITVLGVKFKAVSTPRQVNGIIYQDFDWQGLMLAPYNSNDFVGGVVVYDGISSANFHSTSAGII